MYLFRASALRQHIYANFQIKYKSEKLNVYLPLCEFFQQEESKVIATLNKGG